MHERGSSTGYAFFTAGAKALYYGKGEKIPVFDLVIRNGLVADGTRRPASMADLCIRDGRISEIVQKAEPGIASSEIDARGMVVSPGFIDIHSHSDLAPLAPFEPESKTAQGVTFELCGNCGISPLPSTPGTRASITEYYLSNLQYPPMPDFSANTLDEYIAQAAAHRTAANYGMLIGHSALRGSVMGFDNRQPTAEELAAMEELLDAELSMGAFGMSLGLIYPPSAFAETGELDALAGVVRRHNALLTVHVRNEGPRVFEAVREMLGVAERTGVHLEISHLKIMTKSLWGKGGELLDLIDEARRAGVHVTCDQYPFFASSTGMTALVPKWAHAGGIHAMLERIEAPEQRLLDDIAREMESRGGAARVMISSAPGGDKSWEGQMLSEVASELGLDPIAAVLHILRKCRGNVHCNYFSQSEEDMERILSRTDIAVASDGYNYTFDRSITTDTPHPRNFATFPHALELARDKKLMPLEDMIHKMTALPAGFMGMTERGTLEKGKIADITIFNPETVGQAGDYINSVQRPHGIEYVIVSGRTVLEHGALTGEKPGSVLRHGKC